MNSKEHNKTLVRLKGKVVRDGKCLLKKGILCEDCEDYSGWGIDIEEHRPDIYCSDPRIIDGSKLTLVPQTNKRKYSKYGYPKVICYKCKKKRGIWCKKFKMPIKLALETDCYYGNKMEEKKVKRWKIKR